MTATDHDDTDPGTDPVDDPAPAGDTASIDDPAPDRDTASIGDPAPDRDTASIDDPAPDRDTASLDEMIGAVGDVGLHVLAVDDPAGVGSRIATAIDGELAPPGESLRTAVRLRLEAARARAEAAEALAQFDAARARAPRSLRVLTDTDALRSLVGALQRAERLVERSRDEVRHRLSTRAAGELAVHPDTIRRAAHEVREARARLADAERALVDVEAAAADDADPPDPWGDHDAADLEGVERFGAEGDAQAQRRMDQNRWGRDERPGGEAATPGGDGDLDEGLPPTRLLAVLGGCVVLAVVLIVLELVPAVIAVLVPAFALGWVISEMRLRQRDVADREAAADNLASMSAIAEQAYGGFDDEYLESLDDAGSEGAADPDGAATGGTVVETDPPEVRQARAERAAAETALKRATADWESLVGPEADPDDIESVLRLRDAQFAVSDRQVAVTPTARAAAGFQRRLQAQWKVAWAALDRDVPPLDEAIAAIDALEADDIHAVTVEAWSDPSQAVASDDVFSDLAAGRDRDQLVADAAAPIAPIVVVDADGSVGPEQVRATCEAVLDAASVVLVVPAPGAGRPVS